MDTTRRFEQAQELPPADTRFMDETVVQMAELMTPLYENFSGKVHGGAILSLLDKVAYVCASRYAGTYCVTVAVDWVEFREPVLVGELLQLTARIVHVGRSSMMVEIVVESQDLRSGALRHTNTCYFSMVAMREGRAVSVPKLHTRLPGDDLRAKEAALHRELRQEFRRRHRALLADEQPGEEAEGPATACPAG